MASIVVSGDTSGAVTLSAPSVAGTTTLTLPSTSGTVLTTASSTGISGSAISSGTVAEAYGGTGTTTGYYGFKNRIINGAMVIDQRNAGAVTANTINDYTLDRWLVGQSVTGKLIVQQNAGSVTPPIGFINYLGITSQSAYSIGSSDYYLINQRIEGYNVADLGWGSANAKTVTLSFQVYSSLTGTFGGALSNGAFNYSYPFTYSIPVANTWTTINVTIAGPTSGTWLTTNGIGLRVYFGLGVGSTLSGTAGSWTASGLVSATGATSVVGTNGATFYITGVQLEKGSTATSFDYRPYGTELQLCQRYYEKSYNIDVVPATSTSSGVLSLSQYSNELVGFKFVATKRSAPTVTLYNTAGTINQLDGNTNTATAQYIGTSSVGYISRTAASGSYYFGHFTASAEL